MATVKQYKKLGWFERFKLFIAPTRVVITNMVVTFIQAFLSVWAASGFAFDKLVLGGAVGAGASAVWNLVIKPYLIQRGYMKG